MTPKNQKGLTLVEVLAVIVIFTLLSTIVYSIIASAIKQQKDQTKEVEQIQNGAYLLKQITKDMRKSLSIVDPPETRDEDDATVTVYTLLGQEDTEQYKYEYKVYKENPDNPGSTKNPELYRLDMEKGDTLALIGRDVKDFSITKDADTPSKIIIAFKINGVEYNTNINFRKGG